MRWITAAVACVAIVATACDGSSAAKTYSGLYISLGDSVAAGNGASDPAVTSFVALLARDEGGIETANLAVAGATTSDVIEKQLSHATEAARGKKLAFFTVSAGGNDLAALIPNTSCQLDPLPASCPLDDELAKVETNLDTIMKQLRKIDGRTPIVLLLYPNFFSGTGHVFEAPAARVLPRLDEVIARVAAKYQHTAVALGAPAFEGRGGQLTHVLDAQFDPHPNDAGHRALADAFEEALRRVK
jgi:lysophospholipase L1-like esterase